MAQFYADTRRMLEQSGKLVAMQSKLKTVNTQLSKIYDTLPFEAVAKKGIQRQIRTSKEKVADSRSVASALNLKLVQASKIYDICEERLLAQKESSIRLTTTKLVPVIPVGPGRAKPEYIRDMWSVIRPFYKAKDATFRTIKDYKKKIESFVSGEYELFQKKLFDKAGVAFQASGSYANELFSAEGEIRVGEYSVSGVAKVTNGGASVDAAFAYTAFAGSGAIVSGLGKTEGSFEAGSVKASGNASVNIFNGDAYASGEIGAYAGKATVSHKGTFLGIEYEAEAGVTAGIGAKGSFGIKDGKLHIAGSITAGFGAEAGITIDLKKTVENWGNSLKDNAKKLGNEIKSIFNKLW